MRQRYFEWIDGEEKENVAILKDIEEIDGEVFFNFIDGERCNQRFISQMTSDPKDLRGKFMVEIESPSNPWTFVTVEAKIYNDESMKGDTSEIPTLHDILQANGQETQITNSDLGTKKLQAPRQKQSMMSLPSIEEYAKKGAPAPVKKNETSHYDVPPVEVKANENSTNAVVSDIEPINTLYQPTFETPAVHASNPIKILVDKCKKHPTDIELSVTIDLPSKAVYDIADSEFENGGEEFVNFIIQDIDVNMIIESLRDALLDAFSEKVDSQKTDDK